jgi:hypothetical protein
MRDRMNLPNSITLSLNGNKICRISKLLFIDDLKKPTKTEKVLKLGGSSAFFQQNGSPWHGHQTRHPDGSRQAPSVPCISDSTWLGGADYIATATRFRLSRSQMSVALPGLDRVIRSYNSRRRQGGSRNAYPFRIYPPPSGFDRGTFDREFMDMVVALGRRLYAKVKAGGRVQMDAIELRAGIFAIRANVDFYRQRRRYQRRLSPQEKIEVLLDDESFGRLKIRSQRVILTLERHMKRANRALAKSITPDRYAAIANAWKAHLLWMWLHIAYFKPMVRVIHGRRIQQQQTIDTLMKMAASGIRSEGYQPPDDKELRRIVRLYVRSARRGREGFYSAAYLLNHKQLFTMNRYIGQFVLDCLPLKELAANDGA